MTKKKAPKKSSIKPVIYVHAKGHSPVTSGQVQALLELDLPLYTHLATDGARQTTHGYDQPVSLLAELHREHPGRPVIFLRAGLQPSRSLLSEFTELAQQTGSASVLVPLSNADALVNPFAGLQAPARNAEFDFSGMVNLLAPGHLHSLNDGLIILPILRARPSSAWLQHQMRSPCCNKCPERVSNCWRPIICSLHDPDSRVFAKLDLKSYESLYPPPFGELSARLQAWMDAGIDHPPIPAPGKPATLHITHSWGGGVAQWIESFIQADDGHRHYQLRSEHATSNQAFGQKLSLYAGIELRCPIASWWLQPPIGSIASTDAAVKTILSDICKRFEIGRVIVSSLIGHSLDALRTGLPTVQVLHDHFPIWPLLGVDPQPYLSEGKPVNLDKALSEHSKSRNFVDMDGHAWSRYKHSLPAGD